MFSKKGDKVRYRINIISVEGIPSDTMVSLEYKRGVVMSIKGEEKTEVRETSRAFV
jgi:hypothetical protein